MNKEIKYIKDHITFTHCNYENNQLLVLPICLLEEILNIDIKSIDDQIDELKKKKKPLQILLNKIKPYIKQNKLRGTELLKAKGIEK